MMQKKTKSGKYVVHQNPQIKIIQHFGGGSGLLSNEIEAALTDNESGNFNVIDNPFQKQCNFKILQSNNMTKVSGFIKNRSISKLYSATGKME